MSGKEYDRMNGSQCLNAVFDGEMQEKGVRWSPLELRWLALTFRAMAYGCGMAQEVQSKKPVVVVPDGSVLVFLSVEEAGEWVLHSQCRKCERGC